MSACPAYSDHTASDRSAPYPAAAATFRELVADAMRRHGATIVRHDDELVGQLGEVVVYASADSGVVSMLGAQATELVDELRAIRAAFRRPYSHRRFRYKRPRPLPPRPQVVRTEQALVDGSYVVLHDNVPKWVVVTSNDLLYADAERAFDAAYPDHHLGVKSIAIIPRRLCTDWRLKYDWFLRDIDHGVDEAWARVGPGPKPTTDEFEEWAKQNERWSRRIGALDARDPFNRPQDRARVKEEWEAKGYTIGAWEHLGHGTFEAPVLAWPFAAPKAVW